MVYRLYDFLQGTVSEPAESVVTGAGGDDASGFFRFVGMSQA